MFVWYSGIRYLGGSDRCRCSGVDQRRGMAIRDGGMSKRGITMAMIALGALSLLAGSPAFGDVTTPGGVPDAGVPPVATGPLVPDGTTPTTTQAATPVVGPLASPILTQRAQIESMGERLTKLGIELQAATQAREQTYKAWQDAKAQAGRLKERADDAA